MMVLFQAALYPSIIYNINCFVMVANLNWTNRKCLVYSMKFYLKILSFGLQSCNSLSCDAFDGYSKFVVIKPTLAVGGMIENRNYSTLPYRFLTRLGRCYYWQRKLELKPNPTGRNSEKLMFIQLWKNIINVCPMRSFWES